MDRFIGYAYRQVSLSSSRLKSNMDRFIVTGNIWYNNLCKSLKSNMDRFIDSNKCAHNADTNV